MLDNWVFIIAAVQILIACILYARVLVKQFREIKHKDALQPMKWLLFGMVVLMIGGAIPLAFVYLNIVWFHLNALWIIYTAVIANAMSKLASGIMLNLIYRDGNPSHRI